MQMEIRMPCTRRDTRKHCSSQLHNKLSGAVVYRVVYTTLLLIYIAAKQEFERGTVLTEVSRAQI